MGNGLFCPGLGLGDGLSGLGLDVLYLLFVTGLLGGGVGSGLGQGLLQLVLDTSALLKRFVSPGARLAQGLLKFLPGPGALLDRFIGPRPLLGQGLSACRPDLSNRFFGAGLGPGDGLCSFSLDFFDLLLATGLAFSGLGAGLSQGPLKLILDAGALLDRLISTDPFLSQGLLGLGPDLGDCLVGLGLALGSGCVGLGLDRVPLLLVTGPPACGLGLRRA